MIIMISESSLWLYNIILQTRFVVGGLLWPNCCRVLHTPVGKPYGGMLQPHCVSGGSRISGFSAQCEPVTPNGSRKSVLVVLYVVS